MRILLLHPPTPEGGLPHETSESIGLGYIAAVLRRDGHEVGILDANVGGLTQRETLRQITSREFDCLGVTAIHEFKDIVVSIIRRVRRARKDALICVGGYLPTLQTEAFFRACPECDLAVIGEGEITASEVFGRIERGEDWRGVPGVAFVRDGAVVSNPPPALVADLDSLPFPARDVLQANPRLVHAGIASSRGCYHRCSFCCVHPFYSVSGSAVPRFRSPGRVVDEIESVVASTGRTKFIFVDDDFIGPGPKTRERAVAIADGIRQRRLRISFTMECRADEIDADLLAMLKEAGLAGLLIGIESGVQRQLDTFHKQVTVEQNRRALELAHEAGLPVRSGFMIFDPYTTVDELSENLQFLRETGLYKQSAMETRVILYRGAPLAEKVRQDGLLIDRGLDLDYRFGDPKIAMMWRVTKATAGVSGFVRRLKHKLGGSRRKGEVNA